MCLPGLRPDARRLGAWPLPAVLALVLLVLLSLRAALTAWPDAGPVPATFRAAIVDLRSAAEHLAPATRNAVGATTQLLIERARSTLEGLEGLAVPLTGAAVARDLVFAEDAMRAAAVELAQAPERGVGATAASIETLASEALRRLQRIDLVVGERQEQLAGSIVWLEDDGVRWSVWRLDRTLHDVVRGLGIVLILAGSLAVALRLLDRSRPLPTVQQLREARPATVIGITAFATFLLGSTGLAVEPTLVPGISPAHTSLPRPGPCGRLETARAVFWEAEESGIAAFSEAVERRLHRDARACLDLGTALAAREATERFLVRLDEADPASRPAMSPSAAPPAVSLALMPAIQDDVARLRASVDALLDEVASLRTERQALAVRLAAASEADRAPAGSGATSGPAPQPADEPVIAATPPPGVSSPPAPSGEAAAEVPAPPPTAPRPFVTTTAVNYRTGPSENASRLGTLPEGARVRLMSESDGWANVRLHDGRSAYVSRAFIRPVE